MRDEPQQEKLRIARLYMREIEICAELWITKRVVTGEEFKARPISPRPNDLAPLKRVH
jgi:hypothetical protein